MKPNELKIGNYYKSVKFNAPVKCEFGDFAELYKRADGAEVFEELIDEMFEPIPLTEEWLIKFGFEFKEWIAYNEDHAFKDKIVTGFVYDNIWCFINYVHNDRTLMWFGRRILHPLSHSEEYIKSHGNKWRFEQKGITPQYVHQIQNLYFSLTGEELST